MSIHKDCNPPRTTSARKCRKSWKEAVMSVYPSLLTLILSRLMIMLAAAWIIATGSPAIAADVAIQGQVRSLDGTPIHMIKVSVYRDLQLVERDYTDAEGKYMISVPAGEPITSQIRYPSDTHQCTGMAPFSSSKFGDREQYFARPAAAESRYNWRRDRRSRRPRRLSVRCNVDGRAN
jgi:hypothetical protein